MCPQSFIMKYVKKQLVIHDIYFEKCIYSTFPAYLCIASEILSWLNIETNKDIYLHFLTRIKQVLATYNYHISCQHTSAFRGI